jgi:hypothetical protein
VQAFAELCLTTRPRRLEYGVKYNKFLENLKA